MARLLVTFSTLWQNTLHKAVWGEGLFGLQFEGIIHRAEGGNQLMAVVPHAPSLEKQRQGNSVSSRSAWSTYWVPGQLGLHRKTLPQNPTQTHLLPVRPHFQILPKQSTNWEPNIQIYELEVGGILIQTSPFHSLHLIGLFLLVCPTCFLIEPRTSPGMAPPTMGWALPHWSLIKKMSYRLDYSLIFTDTFS